MEIIGKGFIAGRSCAYFGAAHPHATLIAAGVSSVYLTDAAAFEREANLVYDVIRRCKAEGRTAVFLSTAAAGMYGAPDSPGTEEGPVFPETHYGRHKLALEAVFAASGVRWLGLRLSHVVGKMQVAHQLLPSLTRQLLTGKITVYSGASRDLLDIDHLMRAIDLLLDRDVCDEIVNIASGQPEDIEAIVDGLEQRLGTRAERTLVNGKPAMRSVASIAKLTKLAPEVDDFGFGPGYLSALLDRYVDDLAAHAREELSKQSSGFAGR
jgi:nucleoside-diphosphate-sugar epimerase